MTTIYCKQFCILLAVNHQQLLEMRRNASIGFPYSPVKFTIKLPAILPEQFYETIREEFVDMNFIQAEQASVFSHYSIVMAHCKNSSSCIAVAYNNM